MTFTDKTGRSWTPSVNVFTIGRVRDLLGVNLLELLLPNNAVAEKVKDICLLVDVLYILCEAEERGVSDVDFGKAQTMDGIEDGWSAVLEGLVLFSPRGLRPAHKRVLAAANRYEAKAADLVKAKVESPEFEAALEREMDRLLNPPATLPSESTGDVSSSPDSLESSPAATLSGA